MRQKFSNFFDSNCVHDQKYAKVFDKRFVGRVMDNFNFHDYFVRFFYVHGLPPDV